MQEIYTRKTQALARLQSNAGLGQITTLPQVKFSPGPGFVNDVFLVTHPCLSVYILFMVASTLQHQS